MTKKGEVKTFLDDLQETRNHVSNTIDILYEEARKQKILMSDDLKEYLENADKAWKSNYDKMIGYLKKHPPKHRDQYSSASWQMMKLRGNYAKESGRIKGMLSKMGEQNYEHFKAWEATINKQSAEIFAKMESTNLKTPSRSKVAIRKLARKIGTTLSKITALTSMPSKGVVKSNKRNERKYND